MAVSYNLLVRKAVLSESRFAMRDTHTGTMWLAWDASKRRGCHHRFRVVLSGLNDLHSRLCESFDFPTY